MPVLTADEISATLRSATAGPNAILAGLMVGSCLARQTQPTHELWRRLQHLAESGEMLYTPDGREKLDELVSDWQIDGEL